MKITALLLALASTVAGQNPVWERRSHLDKEDLRSAAFWIQKKDASAERFDAIDKLPIDSTYSVLIVDASSNSYGVFVVYGKTNQVYMVLDILPRKDLPAIGPQIREAAPDSALLEFFADYGSYHGTLKYVYDLPKKRIHSRMRFNRVDIVASVVLNGVAYYAAPIANLFELSVAQDRKSFVIAIEPGPGDSPPRYRLVEWERENLPDQVRIKARDKALVVTADNRWETAWELPHLARRITPRAEEPPAPLPHSVLDSYSPPPDRVLRVSQPGAGDQWLAILNQVPVPPTSPERHSGIYVISPGSEPIFYRLPAPDVDICVRFRGNTYCGRNEPAAGSLENDIGPFALEGSTLWFANSFYEGMTGIGGIGSFDLKTRKYEVRHSPEIAPWSSSALLVEKDAIWVGLMYQPEGGAYGGGLVRYDRNTAQSRRFDFPGIVRTIDRIGDSLYLGTTYGLYVLRAGELMQYRFEPVSPGNWGMVTRRVRPG